MSKTLILDIEISPSLAAVWGLWSQNISLPNLVGESEVLCWSAKWEGSDEVISASTYHTGKREMLLAIHRMMEEADNIVTYNGERFDLRILNQEFLFANLPPPKPYHSIDLLRTVRNRFRGTSNKLDWWLRRLGIEQKMSTGGAQLWIDCIRNDPAAWEKMVEYNRADVDRTEQLLARIRPWIPNYPVQAPKVDEATGDVKPVCACGSCHIQRRGYKWTVTGVAYRQYQCMTCGKWMRERYSDKDIVKSPLVHAGQI